MSAVIEKAKQFAIKYHAGQKYGEHDYIYHLQSVVDVLKRHGLDEVVVCSGYLHDTIEDTDATFKDVFEEFGRVIARIVFAVTNEPGKNREEKHKKTHPKIMAAGRDAIALKLADRIANVTHSRQHNHRLFKMYQNEYADFRNDLHLPGELKNMWAELDVLMATKLED